MLGHSSSELNGQNSWRILRFFSTCSTVSNWSCPSTLSRYLRCSFFLALTRARTFACSQLGSLGLLDCNSIDSALWAFFPFPFLFFLCWACCFIMGRCTTNMTTAKQSTIITLVVYFFEFFFFFPNNWTRSIVVCLQICCRFWWYAFVGFFHKKIVARVWRTNKAWRWRHWSRFEGLDVFAFFRFFFIGAGDGGPLDVHGFKIKATRVSCATAISWTN